jgi:hypothetical protein
MSNLSPLDIVDSDCIRIIGISRFSPNHHLLSHSRVTIIVSDAYNLSVDGTNTDPTVPHVNILTEVENLVLLVSFSPCILSGQGLTGSRLNCRGGLARRDACLLGLWRWILVVGAGQVNPRRGALSRVRHGVLSMNNVEFVERRVRLLRANALPPMHVSSIT